MLLLLLLHLLLNAHLTVRIELVAAVHAATRLHLLIAALLCSATLLLHIRTDNLIGWHSDASDSATANADAALIHQHIALHSSRANAADHAGHVAANTAAHSSSHSVATNSTNHVWLYSATAHSATTTTTTNARHSATAAH